MKSLIVLIIISPIIYIGMKNLILVLLAKKGVCGSCTRCGPDITKSCNLPDTKNKMK